MQVAIKRALWLLSIVSFTVLLGSHLVSAAAINDVQLTVSSDHCDGFDPGANSFVVYAKNSNTSRPINMTLAYDSDPPSQPFQLWDANLQSYTDRFPKNLNVRIAPGATMPVGCTINYRPTSTSVILVPITITLSGASYLNPSGPEPAPEDARAFSAFVLQPGFQGCGSGSKAAGLFYLQNLHPYARLVVTISLVNQPRMGQDLAPLSATRVGCSNGNGSPTGILSAKLIYPPGQKTSQNFVSKRTKAKGKAAGLMNPYNQH